MATELRWEVVLIHLLVSVATHRLVSRRTLGTGLCILAGRLAAGTTAVTAVPALLLPVVTMVVAALLSVSSLLIAALLFLSTADRIVGQPVYHGVVTAVVEWSPVAAAAPTAPAATVVVVFTRTTPATRRVIA